MANITLETFGEYQQAAGRTAARSDTPTDAYRRERLANFALGLAGEAGECADAIKKHLFHDRELDIPHIEKELGDVLWYLAMLADTLDLDLTAIAQKNVAKLWARYPQGFNVADANARQDEMAAIE